jgi:predicted nucleic acid-binding Zn ribbon protein
MRDWDDEDADLHESEDPDHPDAGEDEDDEEVPCPYCRQPVYEDAERCPGCGAYLSREDAPRRHRWWLVIGVLLCLAVVLSWIIRR